MPETPESNSPSAEEVQIRLDGVARLVRESHHLDADSRRVFAQLVEELRTALQAHTVPPAQVALLAESTAHLAESLHQHHRDKGLLEKARDRFDGAVNAAFVEELNVQFVIF